jgi:hypothetical protein
MFTEFVLAVELLPNTPKDTIDWIKFLVNPDDPDLPSPVKRPDSPLFAEGTTNAPAYLEIFHGQSSTIPGTSYLSFGFQEATRSYHLTIRSAVRNYQREIEGFLLWLMPYVAANGYAGYFRFQADRYPALVSYPEHGKLVVLDNLGDMIKMVNGQIKSLTGGEDES